MKRQFALLVGVLAVLVVSLPLLAQRPEAPTGFAHTNVVLNTDRPPQFGPYGIFPPQFKAAYGFNQIPNQGQGMTIALVDAYADPNIASDTEFYANYFHLQPCNLQVVQLGTVEGQGWDLEESLDVQQACALAPRATLFWSRRSARASPISLTRSPSRSQRLTTPTWFP